MGPNIEPGGLSARSRRDLATLFGAGQRTVTVDAAAAALGVSRESAARRFVGVGIAGVAEACPAGLVHRSAGGCAGSGDLERGPLVPGGLGVGSVLHRRMVGCESLGAHRPSFSLHGRCYRTTSAPGLIRSSPTPATWSITSEPTASSGDSWGSGGGDRKVKVSDRERTVADMLSDPTLGGGIRHTMEVLDTLLSAARLEDLVDAVERLDNGAAIKRLGYLLEVLGCDTAAIVRPLTSGFPLLDPSLPSAGKRSARWGLRINADVSA